MKLCCDYITFSEVVCLSSETSDLIFLVECHLDRKKTYVENMYIIYLSDSKLLCCLNIKISISCLS